jgi:hypothetical protein
MIRADSLARFRADPHKIRVSIRSTPNNWLASVTSLETGASFEFISMDPELAVTGALNAMNGTDGIDLGMDWAYEHPFGAAGVEVRRE